MEDGLYDAACSACYDDGDILELAESFEAMQGDWQFDHARRIYKKIACREKYPLLQFGQTTDRLALEKYQAFRKLCTYLSGLGKMNVNFQRLEYARKARIMAKVCHLLFKVLGYQARWIQFALKVKRENIRRPAFQDEFGKIVPGRRELN